MTKAHTGYTIQERLIKALEARGWVLDSAHRSAKYTVMKPTDKVPPRKTAEGVFSHPADARYFVGKAGALRYSSKGNVTASASHAMARTLLLREEAKSSN